MIMITSQTYLVNPGDYILSSADLAYVTILGVKRDGLGQTEVSGSPGNREFLYSASRGKIIFDITNPFAPAGPPVGPVASDMSTEKIWVLFNS